MNEKITKKINEIQFFARNFTQQFAVCFVCDNKTQHCLTSCCESDSLIFVDRTDRQNDSLEDPCFFRYYLHLGVIVAIYSSWVIRDFLSSRLSCGSYHSRG